MLNYFSGVLRRETNGIVVGEEFSSPQLPLSICNQKERKLTVQEREHIKQTLIGRVQRNSIGFDKSKSIQIVYDKNSNDNLEKNLISSNNKNKKGD